VTYSGVPLNHLTKLQFQQARLNALLEETGNKYAVVLEGRDSAGKTGTIRELTHYLPLSFYRVNASKKPSKSAMKKWFRYWKKNIDNSKERILFYDRSWHSRALVQAVNGWCTQRQYLGFMKHVCKFERSRKPRIIIKFWLSISKAEQKARLSHREISPLKYWKLSVNDKKAISKYDQLTLKKEALLCLDDSWISINYDKKKDAVLQLITKLNDAIESNQ